MSVVPSTNPSFFFGFFLFFFSGVRNSSFLAKVLFFLLHLPSGIPFRWQVYYVPFPRNFFSFSLVTFPTKSGGCQRRAFTPFVLFTGSLPFSPLSSTPWPNFFSQLFFYSTAFVFSAGFLGSFFYGG